MPVRAHLNDGRKELLASAAGSTAAEAKENATVEALTGSAFPDAEYPLADGSTVLVSEVERLEDV